MKIKFSIKSILLLCILLVLPVVSILYISSCEEKIYDIRGIWIFKESAQPISENIKVVVTNIKLSGTFTMGKIYSINKKNDKSLSFREVYYYIEESVINISYKMDENSEIFFEGNLINENKMEGTWRCIGNVLPQIDSGYWEATRVLNEKDQTVNSKKNQ